MTEVQFIPSKALMPYVQSIMVMQTNDINAHTNLPFYADGLPGIMFQQSENGCFLLPKNKKLSELFLYGQTLAPISLDIKGPFAFIVFQLYPFASKYLLNVNTKELNDECFDLFQLQQISVVPYYIRLQATSIFQDWVDILSELLLELVTTNNIVPDNQIQNAIFLILQNRGQLTIKEVRDQVFLTERTLERKFIDQVGLTPKQFAKIIQFKSSLEQLSLNNFDRLITVGLDSGFSDQSHFIKTFKKYTGTTPTEFLKKNLS